MVALAVVAFILVAFAAEYFVRGRQQKTASAVAAHPAFAASLAVPGGYYVSTAHTWAQPLFSGNARVGIDEFVHNLVGSADAIMVAPVETTVKKGDPIFTVRNGNRELVLRAPISGKVVAVNEELKHRKDALTADPYLAGWIATVEPSRFAEESKTLAIAEEATRWMKNEIARFRDFMKTELTGEGQMAVAGATLLDGGAPARGALAQMKPEVWSSFEREFLK